MFFRKDINGLRAIAVIGVVLFHFNLSWIPGGYAGVDVFFVISGFLMTGIIFRNLERNEFSLKSFYYSRAVRIIPALSVFSVTLLLLGWFFLSPLDYKELSKHILSSMLFLSNFTFWLESGYFDAASQEKWLLHTWSLSTEWQFYVIFPIGIVLLGKILSIHSIKKIMLFGVLIGFIFGVFATSKWTSASYYLLPSRAWEMMLGGIAYLYPINVKNKHKKLLEYFGLSLIFCSYLFINKENFWPGYLAIFPTFGTFFVIQSRLDNSFITGNFFFQKIGLYSYSIYLWHWPIVVAFYYFSIPDDFIYVGLILSLMLGFISYRYVESNRNKSYNLQGSKILLIIPTIIVISLAIYINEGVQERFSDRYNEIVKNIKASPVRATCHIDQFREPELLCDLFSDRNVKYAVLGDSHATEIAYALAKVLEQKNIGVKQFTFSSCVPSFNQSNDFSKCALWYNEAINYIKYKDNIENVVINHYLTNAVFGGSADKYPLYPEFEVSKRALAMIDSFDQLIIELAEQKKNIFIFYPIPELPRNIQQMIHVDLLTNKNITNVVGTDLNWYKERNAYLIEHFSHANYPENVHIIKTQDVFCDDIDCYAVKEGLPLYFDNQHPSMISASKIIDLMNIQD